MNLVQKSAGEKMTVVVLQDTDDSFYKLRSKPEAQFTQDWFSRSIPSWQFLLSRIIQKNPHLRVLEVGVFEGKSTCWLLENFCKTPESIIVAIDSFQGGMEHKGMELGSLRSRFESNIATVGSATKVQIREGYSLPQLAQLVAEGVERFDFISIDASHQAPDVLGFFTEFSGCEVRELGKSRDGNP